MEKYESIVTTSPTATTMYRMRADGAKIREQLDLINSRVISYYVQNVNPESFLDFVARYYRASELYEKIRISVYIDGQLKKSYGRPITLTPEELAGTVSVGDKKRGRDADGNDYFYAEPKRSPDGRVRSTILRES